MQGTLYREELPLGEDWRGSLSLKTLQPGFQFKKHFNMILERGTHAPAVTARGIDMERSGNVLLVASLIVADAVGGQHGMVVVA